MLHMNNQPRYQRIWEDLKTVYICRDTPSAHYIAGLTIGAEIAKGISDLERYHLNILFNGARYADR